MTAYAADTLDLSRVKIEDIIPAVSYTETKARFIDAFLKYWDELRAKRPDLNLPAYDVGQLEADPAVVIGEAGSYVRVLERDAFDQRIRGLLLISATGAALDAIGQTYYGVARMLVPGDDATGTPEFREADERYRLRLQLAPEAGLPRSGLRGGTLGCAKTLGGYRFHALSCDIRVQDADAASLARGNVTVAVYAAPGEDPDTITASVRDWLSREDVKGATDILAVRPATVVTVDTVATLLAFNGPDASALTASSEAQYRAFHAERGTFRMPLYGQAIDAALKTDAIEKVVRIQPAADILAPFGTVIELGAVTLSVQRVGPTYG